LELAWLFFAVIFEGKCHTVIRGTEFDVGMGPSRNTLDETGKGWAVSLHAIKVIGIYAEFDSVLQGPEVRCDVEPKSTLVALGHLST
jgi:hypothetical protein